MTPLEYSSQFKLDAKAALIYRAIAWLSLVLLCVAPARAQPAGRQTEDANARVINGVSNTTVFGLGQSIRITGSVKEGAIAFGGDVIIEGSVDGDVAAIGGSVI